LLASRNHDFFFMHDNTHRTFFDDKMRLGERKGLDGKLGAIHRSYHSRGTNFELVVVHQGRIDFMPRLADIHEQRHARRSVLLCILL
jgi:hypothetical protein